MKKFIIICLILLLLFSLVGCTQKLTEGEVINKKFIEAHTQVLLMPRSTLINGSVTVITIPYVFYYDDDYVITIKGEFDGEETTATYHVTKEIYEEYEISDTFIYDSKTCNDEPSYTKEEQK